MIVFRGMLFYLGIAVFCVAVWAGVVTMIVRYGWIGGAARVAVLVAGYEVVFDDWTTGRDDVDDAAWDTAWDDERAA